MEDRSHLNLMTMALLQTCGYVIDQMPTEVTFDINKFLNAFSIEGDDGCVRPPTWTKSEGNNMVIGPSAPPLHAASQDSSSEILVPFNMDDYCQCRQAEAIWWIDLQEKRASVIARLQPISAEEYQNLRDAVLFDSGPLHRKQKKKSGSFCIISINSLD